MTRHIQISAIESDIDSFTKYLMRYSNDRVLTDYIVNLPLANGNFKTIRNYKRANYYGHGVLVVNTVVLFSILYPHLYYKITNADGTMHKYYDGVETNVNRNTGTLATCEAACVNSYNTPLRFTLVDIEMLIERALKVIEEIEERYHKPQHGLEVLKYELDLYYHCIFIDLQEMQQHMHIRHEQLIDTLRDHGTSWDLEGSMMINDAILAMINESLS